MEDIKKPDFSKLRGPQYTEKHFQIHYPQLRDIINNRYPDLSTFQERLYWYIHDLKKRPVCKICGKETTFVSVAAGYREYCCRKCMNSDPDKKTKVKNTCIKKYGGMGFASKDIYEKVAETNLKRYGVENAKSNPDISKKQQQTYIEKYGGIGGASAICREKQKQTMMKKYGVEYSHQNPEILSKSQATVMEKYGVTNPCLLGQDKLKETKLKQSQQSYPDVVGYTVNGDWICSCPHLESCQECDSKIYITPKNIHRDRFKNGTELCTNLLPVGNPAHTSTYEETIQGWLDEMGIHYETNNRVIIAPKELDIYIPEKKMAIEINGCYWHSDQEKPKKYHINKYLACREKGIQLIQIWEDWMVNKEDIVKSFLTSKLGCCKKTIFARKCQVQEIEGSLANQFLNENHIQGKCSSNYRLGLYYEGKLVAVMCFNKRSALSGPKKIVDSEAELIRFCNIKDHRVIGGASKLLKHYIQQFHPSRVTSYSANDISDGQLYRTLGFYPAKDVSEAYWYIEPGTYKRIHRSIFTRSGICRKWPGEFDINDRSWTEHAVMDAKGYFRIYDSGTTRWTLDIYY